MDNTPTNNKGFHQTCSTSAIWAGELSDRAIKALHPDFEALVVDDISTDNIMQVAMEAGANVWPHLRDIVRI